MVKVLSPSVFRRELLASLNESCLPLMLLSSLCVGKLVALTLLVPCLCVEETRNR